MPTTTVNTENKQIEQIVSLATLDEQSVYSNLNSTRQGLSSEQYHSNALNFGTNIIPNKESRRMSRIILEAFFSPFNILLIMVAVFDAIVNYFSSTEKQSVFGIVLSFLVVVILIIVAAIIKIVFEIKAKRINAQLYSNIETHHLVMRDQKEILVSCNDIVVGDVVRLKIGDIAPADLRVIENCDLAITQATLTGESHSLTKTTTFDNTDISTITNDILHVPNIIYRGSSIVAGTGLGIVFATGTNSFVGQMTNHINAKPHRTYFENGIRKLTVSLSILIIVSCVILFLMKTIFARTIHADWPIAIIESLVFTFGLTVNLAPKTLPTLLNINLSSNANKLYKQQLITKSINRVQSFGAADIICLDKTGTLTENKISVNDFINVNGKRDKSVLLAAFLNSHFQNS
jgi:Mg2+-importing ATPase